MPAPRTEPLSQSELQHFADAGYLTLGPVMDNATLDALRSEEARIRGDRGNEFTLFRSQLAPYSEPIRRFITTGPQIPLAGQLVGTPNIIVWFNQFVTKFPDAASGKGEFPWHQDNGYAAVHPATNVTIWIPLDDVDERNGCVWVMPKSHKMGLLDHKTKNADSWHLTLDVPGDGIPAILKAGEAIAFTGLTLHRSKLNYTDKVRRAFFMEYADVTSTILRTPNPAEPLLTQSNSWVVLGRAPWPQA